MVQCSKSFLIMIDRTEYLFNYSKYEEVLDKVEAIATAATLLDKGLLLHFSAVGDKFNVRYYKLHLSVKNGTFYADAMNITFFMWSEHIEFNIFLSTGTKDEPVIEKSIFDHFKNYKDYELSETKNIINNNKMYNMEFKLQMNDIKPLIKAIDYFTKYFI